MNIGEVTLDLVSVTPEVLVYASSGGEFHFTVSRIRRSTFPLAEPPAKVDIKVWAEIKEQP